jgi:hypothetical protein
VSFSDDFRLLPSQAGVPGWQTNEYVVGDIFNIVNASSGIAFNGYTVYPSGVQTVQLYPSGGGVAHNLSMLKTTPDRLNYLKFDYLSTRDSDIEITNSSGDFKLVLGGEYTTTGSNIILTVGGHTTTLASPAPGLYIMTVEISGAIGARVLKVWVGFTLSATVSINDISAPLTAQNVIVRNKAFSSAGNVFIQAISTIAPVILPSPDLTVYPKWFLRLVSGSLIALPNTTKSNQPTPQTSIQVSTSQDGSYTAPTVLMARNIKQEFEAHYSGTFQLDESAFDFFLEATLTSTTPQALLEQIKSINSSFATATRLEAHLDGEVFSAPIDTSIPERGRVIREPNHADLSAIQIHVRLLERDWRKDSSGIMYGPIF